MAPRLFEFTDFSTGVSQQSPIFADSGNPAARNFGFKASHAATNVVMREQGLEKFRGYDNFLTSAITGAPTVTGIYEYKKTGSSSGSYTIVCAGTKIYTASGGTLTEIYSGITADAFFTFLTFDNVCIMMNGVEAPIQYDGSVATTITMADPDSIFGSAKPRYAAIFRNRIFYGGDTTHPSRVWTPRPGTYNNFDNTTAQVDSFDISIGDGQKLMALVTLSKDMLVAYKQGSIHRIAGANPFGSAVEPFNVQEISRETGCVATRSVVQVGRDQYFLGADGLKRLSLVNDYGDVQTSDPTYEIQDSIDALNYNEADIEKAFCEYIKGERQIYLHAPTGADASNTVCYVHDIATGANQPRSGISASCGAIIDREYYTGGYDGQIYKQLTSDSYNGGAIQSSWESKWVPIGGLTNKKIFKSLLIHFETEGAATIIIQVQVMKQDGTITTVTGTAGTVTTDLWDVGLWDVMLWDSSANTIYKKHNLGRGVAFKVRIVNNNANEYWKVNKIEVIADNLGKVAA